MPADKLYQLFFGPLFQKRFERLIIGLSIIGFLTHLLLIALNYYGWLGAIPDGVDFLESPISALYTPFSFILIYEVYLLVEQLPRSFTSSIQKQFEIIALILIRRIFKDISQLELSGSWIRSVENQSLLIDIGIFLLLFFLVFLFKRLRQQRIAQNQDQDYTQFIKIKKWISVIMVPVLLGLIGFEFGGWFYEIQQFSAGQLSELSDVNQIFYHDFFMILICVDVLILLISLNYISSYAQLIRNSGYVVSTVLIRLSFTADGFFNSLLILIGVAFGVALLYIYNLIKKAE